MGAYNRVNGEPACASETLLQKILFGEFGFEGYVVSDCGAICDINRKPPGDGQRGRERRPWLVKQRVHPQLRRRLQVAEDRRAAGDDFRGDHHRQRGEAV